MAFTIVKNPFKGTLDKCNIKKGSTVSKKQFSWF